MARTIKSKSHSDVVAFHAALGYAAQYGGYCTDQSIHSASANTETEAVTIRFGGAFKHGFAMVNARRVTVLNYFPNLSMPEGGDDFPPEALDALAALFDASPETLKQGFVFFNGETAVLQDQHRVVLIPCYLPNLLEKTEGRYTPIKRQALAALLAPWRLARRNPVEYGALTARIAFDEVESLVVVEVADKTEGGLRAVIATKLRIDSEWFDSARVFDALGTIPDTTFTITSDALSRAVRKTAIVDHYDREALKKKARDDKENSLFAFFVSYSGKGVAVAASSSQFVSDYEKTLRFADLTTVENEGYMGNHGVWLQYLRPVLKMQDSVKLGFGESSEGDKYLVAVLDNGVRVAFDAGTPKVL
jgi:hypothetical protein